MKTYEKQLVDIMKVDLLLVQKISKRHFLRDSEKSFQEVTPMGLEPQHFFSFLKYLNKYGFWPSLYQSASHGPFCPNILMPLATIFVEIFQKEKKWWGSGPIGVTSWKDFEISLKKWRFEFFCLAKASTFKMSMSKHAVQYNEVKWS